MDRPESILTDAETHTLISSDPFTLGLSIARLKDFILQVEKAVIDKLAEQEPVVYRFLRPSTQQYVYITDNVPKTIKEFEPLYLAPTLPLEPSDELIAEVKKMADIRLITGKAELFNVREIIHTIVHHPFAN